MRPSARRYPPFSRRGSNAAWSTSYGWPILGIFDLGWEKVTRFRMEPAFYSVEVNVLVNNDVWKSLNDKQKKVLTEAALWLEGPETTESPELVKA
ncbi:MAG: hypothetical protein M5U28_05415, partial [Sandaracinaceae bacterium]|nr:hypothetical protein [Sandaracinaceae bacterium]